MHLINSLQTLAHVKDKNTFTILILQMFETSVPVIWALTDSFSWGEVVQSCNRSEVFAVNG